MHALICQVYKGACNIFITNIPLLAHSSFVSSHRAATNCDLFMLTKKDLDEALSYYPEIAEQIKAVAGNRADKVKKRAQIAQQAKSEGKSAGDAAAAAAKGTSDMEDEGEKQGKSTSSAGREQNTDEGGQSTLGGCTVQLHMYPLSACLCTCVQLMGMP